MQWIPPIITGLHVILFGVLTYLGYRQRKRFMAFQMEERRAWTAASEKLVELLTTTGREER